VTGEATTWRLFVAIRLPEAVKDAVEKVQSELRDALPEGCIRWTKRSQFHLTLEFLGNVNLTRVEGLTRSLQQRCEGLASLRLKAERIGFFPSMRYPRVVWVWVHDAEEQLSKVQSAVKSAVQSWSGEQREEPFTGHVTLGRCQGIKRREADVLSNLAMTMVDRSFGEWTAKEIELIRSELSPNGSRYTVLASVPLGEAAS
jgi:2'-5' RNA ligase